MHEHSLVPSVKSWPAPHYQSYVTQFFDNLNLLLKNVIVNAIGYINNIFKKMPTSCGTKCCVDFNSASHFLWDTNVATFNNSEMPIKLRQTF